MFHRLARDLPPQAPVAAPPALQAPSEPGLICLIKQKLQKKTRRSQRGGGRGEETPELQTLAQHWQRISGKENSQHKPHVPPSPAARAGSLPEPSKS